jgi:hypothetical protein
MVRVNPRKKRRRVLNIPRKEIRCLTGMGQRNNPLLKKRALQGTPKPKLVGTVR